MRAVVIAVAGALAACAAPAAAAPPWSAPMPVAGSADAFPLLERGLLTFGVASADGRRTTAFGAPVGPDGTVGAAERIKRQLSVDALATYGNDRVIAAGTRVGADDRRPLGVAFARAGEPLGRLRTVVRRAGFPLALDANRAGAAALVTSRCQGTRCTPVLIVRRPGRRFGRPIRLGRSGRVTAAAVAVNARGDALAAWARNGTVYARVRRRGRLGRLQRLGRADGFQAISADLAGRSALVAFGAQGIEECEPTGPFRAWVAYAERRTSTSSDSGRRTRQSMGFRRRQRLETVPASGTGAYVAGARVRASIAGGRATVFWTGRDGEFFAVRSADLGAGRAVVPQTISPPGRHAVLADVAEGFAHELVIAWVADVRGADPVVFGVAPLYAVMRPVIGGFGPPEAVSAPDVYVDPDGVGLALPQSFRAVAAWRQVGEPIHTAWR